MKRILAAAAVMLVAVSGAHAATAWQSDDLAEGFGVNTHMGWFDTGYYTNQAALIDAMIDLRVRHFRDSSEVADAGIHSLWDSLYSTHGMRITVVSSTSHSAATSWSYLTSNFSPGQVGGIEGRNEPNSTSAASAAADHIRALYPLVRANSAWNAVPVYAPSFLCCLSSAGSISGSVDFLNAHPYPGSSQPEGSMNPTLDWYNTLKPGGPFVVTETGYHTKTDQTGHLGLSPAAAKTYFPRILVDTLLSPSYVVQRAFFYEMMDNNASWAIGTYENQFGLIKADGTRKDTYKVLKSLINATDDPGPPHTPGTLSISTSGSNPQVVFKVLKKRSGAYNILIWQNVSVWNSTTKTDISVSDVTEVMNLPPGTFATAKVMHLNGTRNWDPVSIVSNTVTLPVGPGISILRLMP